MLRGFRRRVFFRDRDETRRRGPVSRNRFAPWPDATQSQPLVRPSFPVLGRARRRIRAARIRRTAPQVGIGARGQFEELSRFRSEEHTSELQSLMRISYAVFCLKKKTLNIQTL